MVKRLNSGQRRCVSRQIASSASLKTWVWFQRPTERWTKGKNQPSKLSSDLHMHFMVHAGTQHMHSHARPHTNNRWFILNSKKKKTTWTPCCHKDQRSVRFWIYRKLREIKTWRFRWCGLRGIRKQHFPLVHHGVRQLLGNLLTLTGVWTMKVCRMEVWQSWFSHQCTGELHHSQIITCHVLLASIFRSFIGVHLTCD